ncbi:hypothetical protein AB0D94_02745 [Streptomyces sp. NPDC048255]|uniref:hypothetical protein n=1 Tax=Streptomyces sp. NPDC048255 TaxID=3154713 RepID=UPI0033D32714
MTGLRKHVPWPLAAVLPRARWAARALDEDAFQAAIGERPAAISFHLAVHPT